MHTSRHACCWPCITKRLLLKGTPEQVRTHQPHLAYNAEDGDDTHRCKASKSKAVNSLVLSVLAALVRAASRVLMASDACHMGSCVASALMSSTTAVSRCLLPCADMASARVVETCALSSVTLYLATSGICARSRTTSNSLGQRIK